MKYLQNRNFEFEKLVIKIKLKNLNSLRLEIFRILIQCRMKIYLAAKLNLLRMH